MNSTIARILAPAWLAATLAGCSGFGLGLFGGDGGGNDLARIRVVALAHANTDMATALDIVFVHDAGLAQRLPANAPAWFDRRAALQKANPRLDVVSLQIPPGATVEAVALPPDSDEAVAVLAYAGYVATPGQAPLDLSGATHALIRLKARDMVLARPGAPAVSTTTGQGTGDGA